MSLVVEAVIAEKVLMNHRYTLAGRFRLRTLRSVLQTHLRVNAHTTPHGLRSLSHYVTRILDFSLSLVVLPHSYLYCLAFFGLLLPETRSARTEYIFRIIQARRPPVRTAERI